MQDRKHNTCSSKCACNGHCIASSGRLDLFLLGVLGFGSGIRSGVGVGVGVIGLSAVATSVGTMVWPAALNAAGAVNGI